MRWHASLLMALLISSLVPSSTHANESPWSSEALIVQAADFEGWNDGLYVKFLAPSLAYGLSVVTEPVVSNSPTVTVQLMANLIAHGYGWEYFSSHGNDCLAVEFYASSSIRDATITSLLQSGGYTADDLIRVDTLSGVYGIGLKPHFFTRGYWFGTFVHVSACKGAILSQGMPGALGFVGYNYSVAYYQSRQADSLFYHRLGGFTTPQARTLGQAVSGLQLSWAGDPNAELAPMVSATDLIYNERISGDVTRYVKFSGPMNTAPAENVVRASGAMQIVNAFWQGNDQLAFTVRPRYKGPGQVWIAADTTSGIFGSAKSYPGLIPLVGNVNGPSSIGGPGTNGYAPFGDYAVAMFSDAGGDNPAAAVTAFTAVAAPSGIQANWSVESEAETERYRIERASDWSGPFVTVGEVPATQAHHYQLDDPNGQVEDIYRLVEVETSGRELRQAEEQAVASLNIAPDQTVTASEADSLASALLQRYPTQTTMAPQDVQPIYGWVAVIPDESWRWAIQPLVNYHQSQGMVAQAMTLDELGSWANETAFSSWAVHYGLCYLVNCADANNWITHDDPNSYVNGWSYPGYGSQAQYDLLPTHYLLDPVDEQPHSQTWFTRHFACDWLNGADVDGDSLPDIAYGRLPARTPEELAVMVAKTITGDQQTTEHPISVWGEFRSLSGLDGPFAQLLTDSTITTRLQGKDVRKLYNTDANPLAYWYREQQAIAELVDGRTIIQTSGTQSNRSKWAIWLDQTQGFSWSQVPDHTVLPLLVATSCDILDFDRSEDPTFGRPLIERALLELQKGPFAAVGFTRGTWQHADYMAADEFYRLLYGVGARSIGEAWITALHNVVIQQPGYKSLMLEAIMLGDPAVTIPGMRVLQTTDVEDILPGRLAMTVSPNPGFGARQISFGVTEADHVQLAIFDLQGRKVITLIDRWMQAGHHTVRWVPQQPGLYFVRVQVGSDAIVKKVVVLQ